MAGSVAERLGRAAVVTACVQAANVWSSGEGSLGQRWQRVAELHSRVALAHLVHSGRVLPLVQFADRLTGPLMDLLPEGLREEWDDIPLIDGDGLSGQAADVLRENLAPSVSPGQVAEWDWQSLSAEKVQGWLYNRLLETGTQAGYVAARLAVIRQPAGELVAINDLVKQVGLPRDGLYERIPAWAWACRDGERFWFGCPICRWPMRVQFGRISCRYPPHQQAAGSTAIQWPRTGRPRLHGLRRDRLRAMGACEDVEARPVEGHVCLVRPVWRYSTIPGWEEWRLAEKLRAIVGVTAELWPHTDAYDLAVEVPARRWKRQADLKDYADPGRLAAELGRKQALRRREMVVVVPEYRANQVGLLNERLQATFGGSRRRFALTAQQFLRRVSGEAAKARDVK